MFTSMLRALIGSATTKTCRTPARAAQKPRTRLCLEQLEDRTLLSTVMPFDGTSGPPGQAHSLNDVYQVSWGWAAAQSHR
jgi:hypothetical protein